MHITVSLDTPIVRGETAIASVDVRKPDAGEMRGLTLRDVGELKVDTMIKLLPRITSPTLTEAEVAKMPLEDLMAVSIEVAGFLLQKGQRTAFPAA